MSKGSILLLEAGRVWPTHVNIVQIARALGVKELDLFSWAHSPSLPAPLPPTPQQALQVLADFIRENSAKAERRLASRGVVLDGLSDDQWEDVQNFITSLRGEPEPEGPAPKARPGKRPRASGH